MVELQNFKTEHGKWPRFRKADSEAERVLGVWLHAQRQKAQNGQLAENNQRALDTAVPGWNTRVKNRL